MSTCKVMPTGRAYRAHHALQDRHPCHRAYLRLVCAHGYATGPCSGSWRSYRPFFPLCHPTQEQRATLKLPTDPNNLLTAMLQYAGLLIPAVLLFWAWYYDLPEPEPVAKPSWQVWLGSLLGLAALFGLAALSR